MTHYTSSINIINYLGIRTRHEQRTALGHGYAPCDSFGVTPLSQHSNRTKVELMFTRPTPTPIIDQGGHAYTYTLKSPMEFPGGPLTRRSASPPVRCTIDLVCCLCTGGFTGIEIINYVLF